jgi:hypothetical protein
MNMSEGNFVRFFISYANSDHEIAEALYDELVKIDRNRVKCFLDTQSIDSGVGWEDELNRELKRADWLVCVYTGEQSEFCGYEIGVFAEANGLKKPALDSRLVCLHDVPPPLPAVFRSYQNRLIQFPPRPVAETFDENAFFLRAPLAKFFADVYKYKDLYVPADAADSARQVETLGLQVRRITAAFKSARGSDVASNTSTQLGVEIAVPATPGLSLARIPDTAVLKGTYESLKLSGILPARAEGQLPETTWKALREAAGSQYRSTPPPWMEQLEQDMLAVANEKTFGAVEATFASKDQTIYRTILSRYIRYENGNHKFEVLFVPTLPRHFLGDQSTSMILAGLVLASRFRFAYLEEPDRIMSKFANTLDLDKFSANCWQIRYDLDRLQHEAVEFGLLDPETFVRAFGDGNRGVAEQLLLTSAKARDELLTVLPEPYVVVTAEARPAVKAAIGQYLRAVEPVNTDFLLMGLDIFRKEMARQTERSGKSGW